MIRGPIQRFQKAIEKKRATGRRKVRLFESGRKTTVMAGSITRWTVERRVFAPHISKPHSTKVITRFVRGRRDALDFMGVLGAELASTADFV